MKIVVKRTHLNQALQTVRRVVPSKPQLPILQAVLVKAADNQIELSATDLYTGIKTTIPGKVEEPGSAAILAQVFADTINHSNSENITLELEDSTLSVSGDNLKATIQTFDAEEYPDFPEKEGQAISFTGEDFEQIVKMITFATAKDDARPVLTAVNFVFNDNGLEVVATDGFRLGFIKFPHKFDADSLLVPAKALHEVARLQQKHSSESVELMISQEMKQLFCSFADTQVVVRLIEGDFPPYQKIMPAGFTTNAELAGDELAQALKGALVFARESSNIITFTFLPDKLEITSSSPSLGNHQSSIPANVSGNTEVQIAFNAQYLMEFLAAAKPDKIWFGMNESLQPAMVRPLGMDHYQYIVMPFRLNS